MSHDDFAFEPIRGIPVALPRGEELLWQGAPRWLTHAIHAYYVRAVALYFGLLAVWGIGIGLSEGHTLNAIARSTGFLLGLGAVAVAVLGLLAYFGARTTVYSITSERILVRHGIAVPITMNIPFSLIEGADLKLWRGSAGDIALRVRRDQRVGYLVTWPHVRPGRITHPEPSFRSLPDAANAAAVLGRAVSAYAAAHAVSIDLNGAVTAAGASRPGVALQSAAA